jgi:demethylmenaquinone methyltransferase/2-methoxy-6-polyprenyl-1,4-benzoquinol methylase
MSTNDYAYKLRVTNPLLEPVVRQAIQSLQLPSDSRGLDTGCGLGLQALLLAAAIGPGGRVTGLDISAPFLVEARHIALDADFPTRLSLCQGSIDHLPFDNDSFDWIWSANCVGYPIRQPLAILGELARVIRPGGILAVLIWSTQMLLPGHPQLEARLNATVSGVAPFRAGMAPEQHSLRLLGWFRRAGFVECSVQTFAGNASAPLAEAERAALAALIEMRWKGTEPELSAKDKAEFQHLCWPESPGYILNLPDYYAFFTYSMFRGRVRY